MRDRAERIAAHRGGERGSGEAREREGERGRKREGERKREGREGVG